VFWPVNTDILGVWACICVVVCAGGECIVCAGYTNPEDRGMFYLFWSHQNSSKLPVLTALATGGTHVLECKLSRFL